MIEFIIAVFQLLLFIFALSMVIIVPVFFIIMGIHQETSGKKYENKELLEEFKKTVSLTFLFTIIGGFLMIGFSKIKKWFED